MGVLGAKKFYSSYQVIQEFRPGIFHDILVKIVFYFTVIFCLIIVIPAYIQPLEKVARFSSPSPFPLAKNPLLALVFDH